MKHVLLSGAVSALLLSATPAFAQSSSSGQFNTNTTVSSTCTVSSGSWDVTEKISGIGSPWSLAKYDNKIVVKCTKGTPTVTLTRNTGLNSTCKQNGLNNFEQLLKSDNGDYLAYAVRKATGGRSSWECDKPNYDPKLDFSNTDTQEFLFELEVGSRISNEARRLYNIAPAGTYSDTMTFSVTF